jgi:hypothetical protein
MNQFQSPLVMLIFSSLLISSCTSVEQPSEPLLSSLDPETLRPLLTSERIRLKFGSYGIDVIRQNASLRVSNLYSLSGNEKITRTLAVVVYPVTIPVALLPEHEKIRNGQSIGETFKGSGWKVEKKNLSFTELAVATEFAGVYSAMGNIEDSPLATQVYELSVARKGARYLYATIAEVNSPEYLDTETLRNIYRDQAGLWGAGGERVEATLRVVSEEIQKLPLSEAELALVH